MKQSLSRLLEQAASSDYFCFLNPNDYSGGFPLVLASGDSVVSWECLPSNPSEDYFGFLSFDSKNEIFQNLKSNNTSWQNFPASTFFKADQLWNKDQFLYDLDVEDVQLPDVVFDQKVSRNEYIFTVDKIKQHILNGDVYELNYCIPFVVENVELNVVSLYKKLNLISPMPFSALLKLKENWLICASPERYLKKSNRKVVSQPIKGTIRRGATNEEDIRLIKELKESEKERAENLMIVDLVRNDLNRCCKVKSVQVDELFGIYEFPQVYQMISTVSGELEADEDIKSIIKKTFPMGSMTGAPKLKALELIEKYEIAKRGVFSGSVGYVSKDNNADFNVVIRSLIYNESTKILSFMVGSAITYDCDAEKEYEECLLKASAIKKCFNIT